MPTHDRYVWTPPDDWQASTLIGALCRRLEAPSYDALLAESLNVPTRYWAEVMRHLQFRWRTPYTDFCRMEEGPALPRWFAHGQLNWVDSVFQHADGPRAEFTAVVAESESGAVQTLTYRELRSRVLQLAGGLSAAGVAPGTRVGLMMGMGLPAVLSFLALCAMGAICVPLFTGFGADAAATRLELAGAQWLIASTSLTRRGRTLDAQDSLAAIRERVPGLSLVLHGPCALPGAHSWEGMAACGAPLPQPRSMEAADPFMVVFTSGTTGKPKGTVHTHSGFPLKVLHDAAYHFDLWPGERWFWPSDMGWIVGPLTTVGALGRGATLVCYDGAPDYPAPNRIAQLLDAHAVTHFGASPTLLRTLAASGQATRGAHLQTLRVLITAGEVIDPEHFAWFFREIGRSRLPIINYTGGTEASGALLANVMARPIQPCGFNSISPGVDAYVAGPAGERLRKGTGELVIGSPFIGMTHGFWEARDRYLESYWTQRPGVWSHGDLVTLDVDGQFYVLGRSDDTLKIAGKRVGPAEVESLVLDIAGVREAAAVGITDPIKGQALVVCLTAAPGATGLAALVAERLETALGKPFRPKAIHIVAQLPKTRNGKVMRRLIRDVLGGHTPGDLSSLDDPMALKVLREIAPAG